MFIGKRSRKLYRLVVRSAASRHQNFGEAIAGQQEDFLSGRGTHAGCALPKRRADNGGLSSQRQTPSSLVSRETTAYQSRL